MVTRAGQDFILKSTTLSFVFLAFCPRWLTPLHTVVDHTLVVGAWIHPTTVMPSENLCIWYVSEFYLKCAVLKVKRKGARTVPWGAPVLLIAVHCLGTLSSLRLMLYMFCSIRHTWSEHIFITLELTPSDPIAFSMWLFRSLLVWTLVMIILGEGMDGGAVKGSHCCVLVGMMKHHYQWSTGEGLPRGMGGYVGAVG